MPSIQKHKLAPNKVLHRIIGVTGYEIKKKPKKVFNKKPDEIYKDPLEALHLERGGKDAAFECPLNQIVDLKGFGFGPKKWHPFVKAIEDYQSNGATKSLSSLKEYYISHCPKNAAEAIPGFNKTPDIFYSLPPHLYYLTPWTAKNTLQVDATIKKWTKKDNLEHGSGQLDLENHGFMLHGPVHEKKLYIEHNRLIHLTDSIKNFGYDRECGDAGFRVLKRGDDYLFILSGGVHRAVVMAALGYSHVPGRFHQGPVIIDVKDVDYWPQVRNGVWSKKDATNYFNHLFDFDSLTWANEKKLS